MRKSALSIDCRDPQRAHRAATPRHDQRRRRTATHLRTTHPRGATQNPRSCADTTTSLPASAHVPRAHPPARLWWRTAWSASCVPSAHHDSPAPHPTRWPTEPFAPLAGRLVPRQPSTATTQPQPRDLTAPRPHSPATSQPRDLTAPRPHSPATSQPRDLTAPRPHSPATSQPRDLTAPRPHSPATSQPRDLTAPRPHSPSSATNLATTQPQPRG